MGLRRRDWGLAGHQWYRFVGDRPQPVEEGEIPEAEREALRLASANYDAIRAGSEHGVAGATEAMARLCDAALADPATTEEARERVLAAAGVRHIRGYLVRIERTETGHSAYLPELPGCVATGRTIEETVQAITEAIDMHLDGLAEDGEPPEKDRRKN